MTAPTDAELAILHVLWEYGPLTVRSVNERLNEEPPPKPIGYTTTLKHLQLMAEKGLVTRDESQRSHVYSAAIAQKATQRNLLGRFVERAFGGSRSELVLRMLGDGQTRPEELAEIKRLIQQLEKGDDNA
jgi:predicted transcriptional regulator